MLPFGIAESLETHSTNTISEDIGIKRDQGPFLMPFGRDGKFVSRDAIFKKIDEAFSEGIHGRLALVGMGGTG
jgi:hypothetical protein